MRKSYFLLVAALSLGINCFAQPENWWEESCTSIMVGRKATTDGSVITSHTCDGKYRTWNYMEPAADHLEGEMHQVLKGTLKTHFRGDTVNVRVAGEIPEAAHTFAYLNTAYPCLNEKQLCIGETTWVGTDVIRNKEGMFLIEELERIALQRCSTAREAVILMGSVAEKYGYGDSGECLTVADKNEVWQFEICGAGKDKVGAVWVAQRIPDDCVAVSANIPRIGKLNRKDKANFLCSDNVEQVAKENGLWDGKGEFSFWKAYIGKGKTKNYSDRELFIFQTLAPSMKFTGDITELPVFVKPDVKVDVRQVMALFRATYEGTDNDMCKNVKNEKGEISPVANPWLTTTMRNTLNAIAPGTVEFHRTVAVSWCAYSFVAQMRNWLPDAVGGVVWLSVDNPAQSPRIPIFCGNTKTPEPFLRCGMWNYWPDCALWTFRPANKLATLSWQTSKKAFNENIEKQLNKAFSGLRILEVSPTAEELNDYTQTVFDYSASMWKAMEAKYWVEFGNGF